MPRSLAAALALAVLGVAVAAFTPIEGVLADWSLAATFGIAAAGCAWRAVAYPPERLPWALAAAGIASYTAGSVVYNLVYADAASAPFPSISDWLWISLVPFAGTALWLVGHRRDLHLSWASVLDGLICAFALTGVCAAVVYEPIFDQAVAHGQTYALVLPLVDLFVVAMAIVGCAARSWRPHPVTILFGLAFGAVAIGDSLYVVEAVTEGYDAGTWLDVPFAVGIALLAVAAWSRPGRNERMADHDVRALWLPLGSGTAGVVLLTAALLGELNPVADVATVLVLGAVVVRLGSAMEAYGRLIARTRSEARTDALTGLANRRRLFADLAELQGSAVVALFDLDGFKAYNDRYGHGAGDELLARLAAGLRQAVAPEGIAYRMGGDEFCVVVPAAVAPERIKRAAAALSVEDDSAGITCSWGSARVPEEAPPGPEALKLADERMYTVKNSRPSSAGTQLREALVRVLDVREPELHEHVRDVGRLAGDVARRLGMPEHEVAEVVHGAELHDVGKLAIPESILHKPGPLTDEEWEVMRRHTILGEQLLSGIPALATAASLVRSSHERWDGAGYPDGLAGEEIPLGARIIAVCDAYDAIVTDRPYRRGGSEQDAAAELRRCAGSQFDPVVVAAFLAVVGLSGAGAPAAAAAGARRAA